MVNQVARAFSTTVSPVIDRQVKESISKNLVPSSAMHQELSREIRSEMLNLKKEVLTWQSEALRSQEARNADRTYGIMLTCFFDIVCHSRPGAICPPAL